jgi:glucosamine--fructose-6-phosphate aminotransferase (isomerizing)
MCNIAGYLGKKQAAPILLEMLRRQEPFDGDMLTGIATIHEGKLYYRRFIGNAEQMIQETDVLEMPGTVGIAHTRPSGTPNGIPYHPFLSQDEKIAVVTNGMTPTTKYCSYWDEAVDLLDEQGYSFIHESENPNNKSPKLKRNGNYVSPAEARVHLLDYYMRQGKDPLEAMAITCTHMFSDNITVMLNENYPDAIYALRSTRPMEVIMENGETYMATTRFAFPEELQGDSFSLPLAYACAITRDGVQISKYKVEHEKIGEMSAYTYQEGYKRLEAILQSAEAPMYLDDLGFKVMKEMRDLWDAENTYIQHAKLLYDVLWQFEKEGRLRKEIRVQERPFGTRRRYYFWLEE